MAIRVNGGIKNPLKISLAGMNPTGTDEVKELYYNNNLIWPANIDDAPKSYIVAVSVTFTQSSTGGWSYTWTTSDEIPSTNPVTVSVTGNTSTSFSLTGTGNTTSTALNITTSVGTPIAATATENSWVTDAEDSGSTSTNSIINPVATRNVTVSVALTQNSSGYWFYGFNTSPSATIPASNPVTVSINGTSFNITGTTGTNLPTNKQTTTGTTISTGKTGSTYFDSATNTTYTFAVPTITISYYTQNAYFNVTPMEINRDYQATAQTLTIDTNTGWTLSKTDSWIHLGSSTSTSSSVNGDSSATSYVVYFDENSSTGSSREAYLTFTYGDNKTKQIHITQTAKPYIKLSTDGALSFKANGGAESATVTSSGPWYIKRQSTGATFYAYDPETGTSGTEITVTAPTNTGGYRVEYLILALRNYTDITTQLSWYQEAASSDTAVTPTITLSSSTSTIAYNTTSFTVGVYCNATSTPWVITGYSDNGMTGIPTGGTGNSTFTVTVPANDYESDRVYSITAKTNYTSVSNVTSTLSITHTKRPDSRPIPELKIIPTNPTVGSGVTSTTFTVSGNSTTTPWSVAAVDGATAVTPTTGTGTRTVTARFPANTSTTLYKYIRVTGTTTYATDAIRAGSSNATATGTTIQNKKTSGGGTQTQYINPNPSVLIAAASGSVLTTTVSANTSYVIHSADYSAAYNDIGDDPDPMLINGQNLDEGDIEMSSGNRTLTITVPEFRGTNTTLSSLNDGIITINMEGTDGAASQILIMQPELPYISNFTSIPTFNTTGGSVTRTMTANTTFEITSKPNWLRVISDRGTLDAGVHNLTIIAENTPAGGSGTLTFTTTATSPNLPNMSRSYNVSIPQLTSQLWITIPSSTTYTSKSIPITVSSNTKWEVGVNQSWLALPQTTGVGTLTFNATVAANSSSSSRSVTLTGHTTAGSSVSRSTSMTQYGKPVTSTLTLSPQSQSISYAGDEDATYTINSNTSWTLTTYSPWCSLSQTAGTGNATITITAEENPYTDSRTAVLAATTTDGNAEDTSELIQTAAPDTSSTSYDLLIPDFESDDEAIWYISSSSTVPSASAGITLDGMQTTDAILYYGFGAGFSPEFNLAHTTTSVMDGLPSAVVEPCTINTRYYIIKWNSSTRKWEYSNKTFVYQYAQIEI